MTKLHELLRCDLQGELHRAELCLQMAKRLDITPNYAKKLLEANGYGKVYYKLCGVVYVANDNGRFGTKRANNLDGCVVVEERGVLDLKNFHKNYKRERTIKRIADERIAKQIERRELQKELNELLDVQRSMRVFRSCQTERPNRGKNHCKTKSNKLVSGRERTAHIAAYNSVQIPCYIK